MSTVARTTRRSLLRPRHLLGVVSLAALVGCGVATAGDGSIDRTTQALYAETSSQTLTPSELLIVNIAVGGSTLTIQNGNVHFALNPAIASYLPAGTSMSSDSPLGPIVLDGTFTELGVGIGYTATISGVNAVIDLANFSWTLQGSDIVVSASTKGTSTANAQIVTSIATVNPTLSVPNLTATLHLQWNSGTHLLSVVPNSTQLSFGTGAQPSASGCGAFGWCSDILDGYLSSNQASLFASAVPMFESALDTSLSTIPSGATQPTATTDFDALATFACGNEAPPMLPGGISSPPFSSSPSFVPWNLTSATISNGTLECNLSRIDVDAPPISGVVPASGGVGDTITLNGVFGTTTSPAIYFGSTAAQILSCGPGGATGLVSCTVKAPPGSGTVDVTVVSNGTSSGTATTDRFAYNAPIVTSISPASGAITGGTTVTLTGSGFDSMLSGQGKTQVFFGAVASTNVWCDSDTVCHATSPAHAAGTVSITVNSDGAVSAVSTADAFTYGATPSMSSIQCTPASGTLSVALNSNAPTGGALITLTSSDPSTVKVPASVTIPAGQSYANFASSCSVGATGTGAGENVLLTGKYLSTSASQSIAVTAGGCTRTCAAGYTLNTVTCACTKGVQQ